MNEEIMDTIERRRIRYLVKVDKVRPALGTFEDFAPEIAEYVTNNYAIEKIFGTEGKGFQIVIFERKGDGNHLHDEAQQQ
jgi:hypothetical protein